MLRSGASHARIQPQQAEWQPGKKAILFLPEERTPMQASTHEPRLFTTPDERWTAVTERDAAADTAFVYSVSTTGVYCRPSCGARRPRREHVAFHDSPEAAERAGFRPC